MVRQPLLATEMADKFDILILTQGGGPAGQAGACRLGIARAFIEFNSELRPKLKLLGLLTRDPRQHVVLTGRGAPPAIIEMADLVSEVVPIKHPYKQGVKAQLGIEF